MRQALRRTKATLRSERLEERRLLSISPSGSEALEVITWQGRSTTALADQWIARFDGLSGSGNDQLAALQQRLSSTGAPIDVAEYLGRDGTVLLESDLAADQLMATLGGVAGFRYAEPNFTLSENAVTPNDPSYASQWWLNGPNGIGAPDAWQFTTGSGHVVMGVIDTGVQLNHPDLAANIWTNPGEIAANGIDDDLDGYVDDVHGYDFAAQDSDPNDVAGHGTSVAGIMGAVGNNANQVAGINWHGQLMSLRYLNENEIGSTADAIAATNYATMMRTDFGINIRALNNSYGIAGYSQGFYDAVAAAGDAGILFVVSAGNSNTNNDSDPVYPANFALDNVLSVAAIDSTGAKSSFSSFGHTTVHLGAPGSSVLTTAFGGGTRNFSGTSAAAPVVTGVAGLLWDADPYASVAQIRNAILNGAVPTAALSGITVTGGRVNAFNSMQQLGLRVISVTPDDGEVVHTQPTDFTVQFADDFNPASIDPANFTVNGVAADSFSQPVEPTPRTVIFHFNSSPVTSEGEQTIHMAQAGALRAGDGVAMHELTTHFRYSLPPLAVVSITPTPGSVVAAGQPFSLTVEFNRPIDPGSVGLNDLALSQGTIIQAGLSGPDAVTYAITGVRAEGTLHVSLPEFAVHDLAGNLLTPFSADFVVDIDQVAANDFQRIEPLGELIFQSLSNPGVLQSASDEDTFTFDLNAGETIMAVVTPNSPTAALTVSIPGLAAPVVGAAGAKVVIPVSQATLDGSYGVTVSGQPTAYTVDLYRNTVVRTPNAATTSLDPSRVDLGSGARVAALGTFSTLYKATMDTNPGWTLSGAWGYGKPAGLAGDPLTGYTGNNVIGYNLNGAYANSITTPLYATTPAFDAHEYSTVSLSFRRWLGVQSFTFDKATVQVSNNGSTWTTVYQNSTANLQETSWSQQTIDISAVAAGQSTVFVRWGMGTTNASTTFSGWNIDDVEIRGVQNHNYTVDLTGMVGKRVDVLLKGLDGTDLAGQTVRVIDSDGTTVLATSNKQGSNFDRGILGFIVPHDGVYTVRASSSVTGAYSLVVTESLLFETESNTSGEFVRDLTPGATVPGYVGLPPFLGTYQFTVDPNQTLMVLSANLHDNPPPGQEQTVMQLVEQAPGSLDAAVTGTLNVIVDETGIRFAGGSLDPIANPGSFQPSSTSADFASQVTIGFVTLYASLRNLAFRVDSDHISWDNGTSFDAQGVDILFTNGVVAYQAATTSDSFPVANPDSGNLVDQPGALEFLPGQARITLPFHMVIEVPVPGTGVIAQIDLTSQIVATMTIPVLDDDRYQVTASPGQVLDIEVSPTLAELPDHTLRPRVVILDPLGNEVASQVAPSAGGTVHLAHVTEMAGNYQVVVKAEEGVGEYLLKSQLESTSQVTRRHLFYNGSRYDGNDSTANHSDDGAIAWDKSAYIPDGSTAFFNNYSSYSKGINGIMVDLYGGGTHTSITLANILDDFTFKVGNNASPDTWADAPLPIAVLVRPNLDPAVDGSVGQSGSDRIELIWADNAIQQQWLQVTVKATDNTGLPADDVFYWGSAIGNTGAANTATVARTNAYDLAQVQTHGANLGYNIPINNIYDINRDGLVNASDVTQVQTHGTTAFSGLKLLHLGAIGGFAPQVLPAASTAVARGIPAPADAAGLLGLTIPSLPTVPPALPNRLNTLNLDLNTGPVARYFERLAHEATDEAKRILRVADDVADFLHLDHQLLDSLLERLGGN